MSIPAPTFYLLSSHLSSLLFHYAMVSVSRGMRVLYCAPKAKLQSCVQAITSWDDEALNHLHLKYTEDGLGLRTVLAGIHLQPELPHLVVVDDLTSIVGYSNCLAFNVPYLQSRKGRDVEDLGVTQRNIKLLVACSVCCMCYGTNQKWQVERRNIAQWTNTRRWPFGPWYLCKEAEPVWAVAFFHFALLWCVLCFFCTHAK